MSPPRIPGLTADRVFPFQVSRCSHAANVRETVPTEMFALKLTLERPLGFLLDLDLSIGREPETGPVLDDRSFGRFLRYPMKGR